MRRTTFLLCIIITIIYQPEVLAQTFNSFMPGYMPNSPYGTTRLGDAAAAMAQGSYLVDQSQANINNQTAESMYYDNRLKKTRTFFENRQINGYYRDIEEWQKNTRRQLRGAGLYDREAIEYIYGINKP